MHDFYLRAAVHRVLLIEHFAFGTKSFLVKHCKGTLSTEQTSGGRLVLTIIQYSRYIFHICQPHTCHIHSGQPVSVRLGTTCHAGDRGGSPRGVISGRGRPLGSAVLVGYECLFKTAVSFN